MGKFRDLLKAEYPNKLVFGDPPHYVNKAAEKFVDKALDSKVNIVQKGFRNIHQLVVRIILIIRFNKLNLNFIRLGWQRKKAKCPFYLL